MLGLVRQMIGNRGGGVAVVFAFALVPLIGFAGAALDYGRLLNVRTQMQTAADAAALVAAKTPGEFPARKQMALSTLAQQLAPRVPGSYEPSITQELTNGREAAIRVSVSSSVPMTLMNVIGVGAVSVGVEAKAASGRNELFDVAFVLDTTGSMTGARLHSLKAATTELIDDFLLRRGDPDQIRVSVIPFGQYVNVGLGNRNQPWIDVPNDHKTPVTRNCRMTREVLRQECTLVQKPAVPGQARTCYDDGVPQRCDIPAQPARTVNQCTPVHGPNMVEQCSNSGGNWVRWHGCVGSRDYPHETRDGNYALRIPGLMNISCGSPILEPTNNLQLAKARINALTTAGETYIPAGLIWGWRALSPGAPLAARESENGASMSRYMVLVTDGQNTRSPNTSGSPGAYKFHDGSNAANANEIMRTTCRNMAADAALGIKLYTIAFEVTDPTIKQLLEECSMMNGGASYDAENAAELKEAMKTIGEQISKLRLTQ